MSVVPIRRDRDEGEVGSQDSHCTSRSTELQFQKTLCPFVFIYHQVLIMDPVRQGEQPMGWKGVLENSLYFTMIL